MIPDFKINILRKFFFLILVDKFTADNVCSHHHKENVSLALQGQLSKTQNAGFYCIFGTYFNVRKFPKKKSESLSLVISEIIDFERRGYLNE